MRSNITDLEAWILSVGNLSARVDMTSGGTAHLDPTRDDENDLNSPRQRRPPRHIRPQIFKIRSIRGSNLFPAAALRAIKYRFCSSPTPLHPIPPRHFPTDKISPLPVGFTMTCKNSISYAMGYCSKVTPSIFGGCLSANIFDFNFQRPTPASERKQCRLVV